MASNRFPMILLDGRFAVCRLDADADVPGWAGASPGLASVTRTADELSIVCDEAVVPAGIKAERGWRAFMLQGPVPFTTTGVVSGMTAPLAEAGIGVFILSTFDTDYLLVKDAQVARATAVLGKAGFVRV